MVRLSLGIEPKGAQVGQREELRRHADLAYNSEGYSARARSAGASDGAGRASVTLVTYAQGNNRSFEIACRFHYDVQLHARDLGEGTQIG